MGREGTVRSTNPPTFQSTLVDLTSLMTTKELPKDT